MNRLINRLVSEATAPIGEMSMRLFKMAMLFFLAMSCLIASESFLRLVSSSFSSHWRDTRAPRLVLVIFISSPPSFVCS
jgi:hypothetical protein